MDGRRNEEKPRTHLVRVCGVYVPKVQLVNAVADLLLQLPALLARLRGVHFLTQIDENLHAINQARTPHARTHARKSQASQPHTISNTNATWRSARQQRASERATGAPPTRPLRASERVSKRGTHRHPPTHPPTSSFCSIDESWLFGWCGLRGSSFLACLWGR
jgi:hypothetical protein